MVHSIIRGVLAFTFFAGVGGEAFSQVRQFPIAIKNIGGGKSGQTATKVLQNALAQSGSFKLVTNPNGIASTEAALAPGGGMEAKLIGADGKTIFKRSYTRGDFELNALQFADDITLTLTKKPGIATSQITFVVHRNNRRELFVCDFDGRNARPIIIDGESTVAPAISGNGQQVAYSSLNRGVGSLKVRDLTSGKSQIISGDPIHYAQPAWSPDGKSLAVAMAPVSGQGADLFLIKMRGRKTPKPILETPVSESHPSWSPDGKSLVYAAPTRGAQTGLFIVKPSSPSPKPSPLPTGYKNSSDPDWSPDGTRIAFDSTDRAGKKYVCIAYPKGGMPTKRIAPGADPVWGANSRHLIYTTGSELRRLDTVTGKSVVLVRGIGHISEPDWTH